GKTTTNPGPFVGDNTYNATGVNQDVTVKNFSELDGAFYTFEISIQNDGRLTDQFTIKATGAPGTSWTVTYWHDTTNITAAVEQGTYLTPPLATGAADHVMARISLRSGGDVNRLVTITSSAAPVLVDAVSFGYKETACGC
ncbi:MAG: hypothetical protein QOJ75_1209, partial [Chloroflexota bacterium]|nr:hypothetical protein [Chloroflexota bacterium]